MQDQQLPERLTLPSCTAVPLMLLHISEHKAELICTYSSERNSSVFILKYCHFCHITNETRRHTSSSSFCRKTWCQMSFSRDFGYDANVAVSISLFNIDWLVCPQICQQHCKVVKVPKEWILMILETPPPSLPPWPFMLCHQQASLSTCTQIRAQYRW